MLLTFPGAACGALAAALTRAPLSPHFRAERDALGFATRRIELPASRRRSGHLGARLAGIRR